MDKNKTMSPLMMLIGKTKKPEMDTEEEDSDDSLVAAKAILAAIDSGNAKKLDEALKSHYTLCDD